MSSLKGQGLAPPKRGTARKAIAKKATRTGMKARLTKPTPTHATTVRLTSENEVGLKLLNLELERPINKLINEAVAEYIESQTESLRDKLEQTLANLNAYRRRDPGFRKSIAQFVEAEAALEDPAEGRVSESKAGPALTMVREALRGS